MRIDAHHHLWDLGRRPQPWLTGEALDPINRTFEAAELEPLLDAHGIDATVVVQSSSSLDETRELLAGAAESGSPVAGVVGWADIADPALPEVLASLAAAGPLVGIRHQVQDESDVWWLGRPEIRQGLREIAAAGLVYDLLVTPREMTAAVATVQALPELEFVLDHGGKPPIAADQWEPWAGQLAALAALPNVSCKLSGLITEADWDSWRPQDVLPYARHLLDAFGPERVLFGSDWPVCTLAGRYADVYALAEQAVAALDPAGRDAVLGGNAARVYGLNQL
ncbi:L-fuconolactonase [Streptomyces sp. DvalAA-14]|uniref:amidohydrolase family protein n=1 Tax=unclassified Streptomyces TaxID=2593676 RepID=UPI00081B2F67|nr:MULTISPECIES: amidohydrolase family protein [unclassified Streptomyces]MYS20425.1 amidohydrolase family protein [Streptomyces sp. SID4948]SCD68647.1 L-fuconolactonase [Streptomyces sp. DvalAA-14]